MTASLLAVATLAVVMLGLWFLVKDFQALWRERGDQSRSARRRRLRLAAWVFSFAGLALIGIVQLTEAPVWLADLGIGIVFAGWGAFGALTLVYAYLEGFKERKGGG